MGRFSIYLLLALLASGPASAQIQSVYDYALLPHAPQSDSARTYSYDANGNLIRSTIRSTGASKTLEYTPSNMIFKAGGSEYRYDTSGNRIAKIQRDANGNITKIERYFGAIETDGTTRTKYYFFGSDRIAKKTSAGSLSFYHSDHLNSTSVVTDASGNLQSRMEFYEFGAVKTQEGTESPKYAYTGQEWDKETNLYNYNARMYDSAIGKFASADTIIPNPTNPQSLNRYAYVGNNPLGYLDPTGHAPAPTIEPDEALKLVQAVFVENPEFWDFHVAIEQAAIMEKRGTVERYIWHKVKSFRERHGTRLIITPMFESPRHLPLYPKNPARWDPNTNIIYFAEELLDAPKEAFRELSHEFGAVAIAEKVGGKAMIPYVGDSSIVGATHVLDARVFHGLSSAQSLASIGKRALSFLPLLGAAADGTLAREYRAEGRPISAELQLMSNAIPGLDLIPAAIDFGQWTRDIFPPSVLDGHWYDRFAGPNNLGTGAGAANFPDHGWGAVMNK